MYLQNASRPALIFLNFTLYAHYKTSILKEHEFLPQSQMF